MQGEQTDASRHSLPSCVKQINLRPVRLAASKEAHPVLELMPPSSLASFVVCATFTASCSAVLATF